MNRVYLLRLIVFSVGFMSVLYYFSEAYSKPIKPVKEAPGCQRNLAMCLDDLDTCDMDLEDCENNSQIFPGDGYSDPSFGTNGHGPALSYTDNGDGTFTDDNTGCMWEKKDNLGGIHDKDNAYSWTIDNGDFTDPDGTLFTDFIDTLNNTCQNNETVDCSTNGDSDCSGVGGVCGFAGYRDWEVPNIKLLQSIVDYSVSPSSSVPGSTFSTNYWSSTTVSSNSLSAWVVDFNFGFVSSALSSTSALRGQFARAHDWSFGNLLI